MSSYTDFALVYDKLMQDVDYHKLCVNMVDLCEKYNHTPKLVLDAACGTGSFTKELQDYKFDVIGVDMSENMLSVARNKLSSDCMLLCQDLCELDLYGSVDTVFCTLDALNHITSRKALKKAFKRISMFLDIGGMFVFDVNTIYKHKKVLANNVFIDDKDDIYLVWQNNLCNKNIVNINLDFFINEENGYLRLSENFDERAYSELELKTMLKSVGMEVLDKKDFYTNGKPEKDSEKIIYIAKKVD